jgi:hypothetical protein
LNVRHFGIVETTALQLRRLGHLQWLDLATEFHKNVPIGSEADAGEKQTQDGNLIAYTFPLGRKVG